MRRYHLRDRRTGWEVALLPLLDVQEVEWLCIQSEAGSSEKSIPAHSWPRTAGRVSLIGRHNQEVLSGVRVTNDEFMGSGTKQLWLGDGYT